MIFSRWWIRRRSDIKMATLFGGINVLEIIRNQCVLVSIVAWLKGRKG